MDTKSPTELTVENSEEKICTPFVNEECGDTMWDDVLNAVEEADREMINKLTEVF